MNNIFKILLLNGPNINLLGQRETDIYGQNTLIELINLLKKQAKKLNIQLYDFQSNSENELINQIHKINNIFHYIIINPAAFTHTSIALRDALLAVKIPFIEVHISNIHARENFRNQSWLSDISQGVICGFGLEGYLWALQTASHRLHKKNIFHSAKEKQ
ncbi:MAG: type II 3-dehydroquinate dehydratase [Buchnera aphidicola (Eriosoma harunire)]